MKNVERYQRVPVVHYPEREWPGKEIQKAPAWCSVDLRDGNQAHQTGNSHIRLVFKAVCGIF